MASEWAWTRAPGPLHRGSDEDDVDARKRSSSRALRRGRGRVSCACWQLGSPPSASTESHRSLGARLHETLSAERAFIGKVRVCDGRRALGVEGATREACMCERTARAGHINTTRGCASREPLGSCNRISICRLLCMRSVPVLRVLFFHGPPSAVRPVHPESERRCRRNVVNHLFRLAFLDKICPHYVTIHTRLAKASRSHASLSLSVPPAECAGQSGPGARCA